jgi:hypothetical protein
VALLQVLLPAGERRYLRDCGIATLPLAQLNAVLAPLGYVIQGTKTRAADRFVLCSDAHGQKEVVTLLAPTTSRRRSCRPTKRSQRHDLKRYLSPRPCAVR